MNQEQPSVSALIDDVAQTGRYEACQEIANQIVGILVAQENEAGDGAERERLREKRRNVRQRMRRCNPNSVSEVQALLDEWGPQVKAAHETGR